jgi:hypothetical protein
MPALGPPYMPRNCASLSCVRGNRNSVASAERHTPTTSPECARSPALRHAVTHGPGKVSTATAATLPHPMADCACVGCSGVKPEPPFGGRCARLDPVPPDEDWLGIGCRLSYGHLDRWEGR